LKWEVTLLLLEINLLLYHRALKCLVAIDLKAREFQPEHVGKITKTLSKELKKYLPTPDEIIRKLEIFNE
jgi:hypothetical protein